MQFVRPREILSRLGSLILLLQPFLTFPVFLSVLLGSPPLWLSWLIALIPLPLRFCITRRLTIRTPFDIPILILTVGMLVSFFLSPDYQLRLSVLNTYLAGVLFYYGLVNNNRTRPIYWSSIAVFILIVVLFLAVCAFANDSGKHLFFNTWAYELISPLSGLLNIPVNMNAVGYALAVIVPALSAIALFRQRTWVRWSAGILAVFFSTILLLSASGGGWIAAIFGMFAVVLFYSTRAFWATLLASVAAVGATFPLWHKAEWVATVFPLPSFLDRVERWQATLVALKDDPLTGLGLGGWWSRLTEYEMPGGPHNVYLGLYSDTGILGAIALVVAVIFGVRLLRRILRSDRGSLYYGITVGIIAGIIASGINGIIEDNTNVLMIIGSRHLYFAVPLLWLLVAWLVVFSQRLSGDTVDNQPIEDG